MIIPWRLVKNLQSLTSKTVMQNNRRLFHLQYSSNQCYHFSPTNYPLLSSQNYSTTKLTKQQIERSSYSQLIDKIVSFYVQNFKQYRIPSALALLEVHHQYKIFKSGDWVLDIGAGPHWAWTELALKLTYEPSGKNKGMKDGILVISNDLKQRLALKDNNVVVVGNFLEEPVRTKIAMGLLERPLDSILIDATPEFSGNQEKDAMYTLDVFIAALSFSQYYLKKGGTIVFKTIESSLSLQNENQAKFFFNEVYRYKPSCFRIRSPTYFYVLKGFMMNDNLNGVNNLVKEYHGAKNGYEKMKIVEKYRGLYSWDPVMIIVNEAQEKIMKMKNEGKNSEEICRLYENDPFVKVGEILELIGIVKDKKANKIQKSKAASKLLTGQSDENIKLPENEEQFTEMFLEQVEKMEKQQLEEKKKAETKIHKGRKQKKVVSPQQKAPLKENQVYMKSRKIHQKKDNFDQFDFQDRYRKQDLYGYNPDSPEQSINRMSRKTKEQQFEDDKQQIMKLSKSFPGIKQAFEKNKNMSSLNQTNQLLYNQLFRGSLDQLTQQQEVTGGQTKKQSKQGMEQKIQKILKKQIKEHQMDKWLKQNQNQQFRGSIQSKLNKLEKIRTNSSATMSSKSRKMNLSVDMKQRLRQEEEENMMMNKMGNFNSRPSKSSRPINNKTSRKQGKMNNFKNYKRNKQ